MINAIIGGLLLMALAGVNFNLINVCISINRVAQALEKRNSNGNQPIQTSKGEQR